MGRTIQFPTRAAGEQHAFNLGRWEAVCADPALAAIEGRIETDGAGNVIMTPPPGYSHSRRQFRIGRGLDDNLSGGEVLTECPVSTADGVRAADVAWISDRRRVESRRGEVLTIAPEICVEVLSPSNTRQEMERKKQLYFDGGAEEVWFCDLEGRLFFFLKADPGEAAPASALCPDFPASTP